MTAIELRALLAQLGLSQRAAARLLGVDDRTVRRWIVAERPIPEPARRLLLLFAQDTALRVRLEMMAAE